MFDINADSGYPDVLCVDRTPRHLDTLSQALRRIGCRPILADNGTQALILLKRFRFDVVICNEAVFTATGDPPPGRESATRVFLAPVNDTQPRQLTEPLPAEGRRLLPPDWNEDTLKNMITDILAAGGPKAKRRVNSGY